MFLSAVMSTLHQKACLDLLPPGFDYQIDDVELIHPDLGHLSASFKIRNIFEEKQAKVRRILSCSLPVCKR